jgi:gentisate 1,2-dioxygenase
MVQAADPDQKYYDALDELSVLPLWRVEESNQARSPATIRPYVWRWADLHPRLMQTTEVVDLESGAERRVLTMQNPGVRPLAGATHTLTASLQLIMPGEIAPAHRHTMAAFRFIIEGQGGYTVVEGEKVPMSAGDLILTPNWTWHDHGNEGDQPMIWFDGLDVPFVRSLKACFYQDFPGRQAQPVKADYPESYERFGAPGLLPAKQRPSTLYSPLNLYKWEHAYEALQRLQAIERDEFDGTVLEYVHPLTGGHILPTMSCYLHGLTGGTHTRARRTTASSVIHVVRGAGYTVMEGQRFDWADRDIIAIPPWCWHEHVVAPDTDAIFFRVSDLPVLEPFGLVREEAYKPNDGHQPLDGAS